MTDTTEETVQNHVPQLSETVPSEPSNLEAAAAHDSRHHGYSLNNGPGLDTAHFSSGSLSNQEQHIAVHLTKTNSLDSPAGPDDNTAHILGPQLNGSAGLEDSLEDGEHSVEEICENESTLPAVTFKGEPRRDTLFADSAASNPDNHVESSNIAPDMFDDTVTTQPADGAELCFASGPTEDATGEGLSLAPVDVAVGAVNAEDAVIIMEAKTATEATRNGTPPHVVTARDVSENPPSSEAPKKLSVHDITEDEVDNVSLSALRWDPPPERPRFNLSFAGCGFLGIYHLGVASTLIHHGRGFLESVECFGGASAGALVASVLAVRGADEDALQAGIKFTRDTAISVHKRRLGMLTPRFSVLEPLEEFLRSIMPEDAHQIATGRLHLSLTRLKNRRNLLVSEFENNDELIKCMLASSYVPMVTGKHPIKIKGKKYIDGGMTVNLPVLPGPRTIMVSPFSGGQDISPIDKTKKAVQLNGQDFHVSVQNMVRGYHAFFPPPMDHLEDYFKKGERDAARFLKKEGLYEKRHQKEEGVNENGKENL